MNLGTRGFPAKCVCLVRNPSNEHKSELWVGSGSLIVIVDPHTNAIKEQIETTTKTNRLISLMTSDGTKNVWTCERGMSLVAQWDVASRTKLFEFHCKDESPLNQLLVGMHHRSDSLITEDVFVDEKPNEKTPPNEKVIADILDLQPTPRNRSESIPRPNKKIDENEKNRRASSDIPSTPTKFKRRGRSSDDKMIPEVIEIENTSVYLNLDKPDGFVQRSLQKKPSLMYPSSRKKRSSSKHSEITHSEIVHSEILSNSMSRPRGALVAEKPVRVTGIIYTGDALWIGRNNGDVLVVAVDDEFVPTGKVVAVLGGQNIRWLGGNNRTVTSLIKFSDKEIISLVKFHSKSPVTPKLSSRRNESGSLENYQLLKYDAISIGEIVKFTKTQIISH